MPIPCSYVINNIRNNSVHRYIVGNIFYFAFDILPFKHSNLEIIMRGRITQKDLEFLSEAEGFISANTDGVEDLKEKKHYDDMCVRIVKIYEILSTRAIRRKIKRKNL